MAKTKTGVLTKFVAKARVEKAASLARKKARLDALLRLIQRRATTIRESFYDIGAALAEIAKDKLYEADGHASFADFLAARKLGSKAQAYKLIEIATKLDRDDAIAAGQERAIAMLKLVDATPEADTVGSIMRSNRRVSGKPLADASVSEIEGETRAVRARARAKRPKTAAEKASARADREVLSHVRTWLADKHVAGARIALSGDTVTITLSRAHAAAL